MAVSWNGLDAGSEVTANAFPGINFPALVNGAIVEPVSPRVTCPACAADKRVKGKPPAFEKPETFAEHYASEHRALVAPDFEGVLDDGD